MEKTRKIIGKIIGNHGKKIIVLTENNKMYELPRMAARKQLPEGKFLFEESIHNIKMVKERR